MSDERVVPLAEIEGAAAKEIERRISELGLDRAVRPEGLTSRMGAGLAGPAREKAAGCLSAWIAGDRAHRMARLTHQVHGLDPELGWIQWSSS